MPEPGTGDVLVRVRAASFTPTELTWPSTWVDRLGHNRRPVIPGHAGLASNGVRNELPPGMLAALILLGAGALSTLLPPVRRRVLARLGR